MFFKNDGREKEENEKLLTRIAELETEIDVLKHDLMHDPMTRLKTKSFFEQECTLYLSIIESADKSTRRQVFGYSSLSIIFFDLDFFKNVNDRYGHQEGDTVLIKVSQAIAESFRDEDTASRWGGEEFAVTLLGAGEEDAKKKADEVRKKVSELRFDIDPDLRLTISAGIASTEKGVDYQALLKRADDSLYRAKNTGRNKVVSYSEIAESDSIPR
jgi:diguanylate cyclase (GGDEF)-like protein